MRNRIHWTHLFPSIVGAVSCHRELLRTREFGSCAFSSQRSKYPSTLEYPFPGAPRAPLVHFSTCTETELYIGTTSSFRLVRFFCQLPVSDYRIPQRKTFVNSYYLFSQNIFYLSITDNIFCGGKAPNTRYWGRQSPGPLWLRYNS